MRYNTGNLRSNICNYITNPAYTYIEPIYQKIIMYNLYLKLRKHRSNSDEVYTNEQSLSVFFMLYCCGHRDGRKARFEKESWCIHIYCVETNKQ